MPVASTHMGTDAFPSTNTFSEHNQMSFFQKTVSFVIIYHRKTKKAKTTPVKMTLVNETYHFKDIRELTISITL